MRENHGVGLRAPRARGGPEEITFQTSLLRLQAAVEAAGRVDLCAGATEDAAGALALIERSLARRTAADPVQGPARNDARPREGQR
jgi:hypothetical protein